ncbi:FUSC family protein [Streptomyces sp. PSKA54]|uniref:FUSC family protein n=1 Tax=Streptomyces himalayensis subsp. aureolus TaxID=2758039 RepID=A0A7W2HHC0_9ACTN|nr:FUSC family protein [Streptomyces himalayensis]MBA4863639.1 FUSC family protein [Streptomyces himalayensis subsp. aureolus]
MGPETDTSSATVRSRPHPVQALWRAATALRHGTGTSAVAGRRAVRVTVAAIAAFFIGLYGLNQPVTATYALFAAVAMAGLSRIPGTGRQRAAVVVRMLPVGLVLVTAGTLLAVRTWAAVVGMLVIGFLLAFAAAAGPRLAGAAPGLQLLYILPCFPPFAPQTLGERLGGMTLGILLIVVAESLLLSDPPTASYRALSADAAMTAARCATELTRPPWTLSDGARSAARAAGEALRPSQVAESERPAGPGPRERALAHTGMAARVLLARLQEVPGPGHRAPHPQSLELLHLIAESARRSAAALRTGRPAGPGRLPAALALYRRLRTVPTDGAAPEATSTVMYRQALLIEAAHAGVTLATAADLALGRRLRPDETPDGSFWYAGHSTARLWAHRLMAHLSPRSVYFQNAVRISLALAAARTVAGVVSLPHGFWAMLAALTLIRTTAAQTGAVVRQALTGALLGALAAAVLLVFVGGNTTAYAVVLPVVMLATFWIGPTRGVGWAQGLFTLVVSVVFAQLAPATWHLAAVRFLDVLTGSVIGLVIGLLAWPRGAHEELRRDVAVLLRTIGSTITSTTSILTAGHAEDRDRPHLPSLQHALMLAESSFAQYQSEPRRADTPVADWQAALMAGHHALRGSRRLVEWGESDAGVRSLGPAYGARLAQDGAELAGQYELVGTLLAGARPLSSLSGRPGPGDPDARPHGAPAPPVYYDAEAWLQGLAVDLDRITAATAGAAAGPPSKNAG